MIVVRDLFKIYDKRSIAGLRGISFSLKEGQVAALMGPNGSGKSTLLNTIAGVLPVEKGVMEIEGKVALFDPRSAPEAGNVQKLLMSSVTVTEDEEKKLQLTRDLADLLEFTFQLRQDVADLSAGQKQKVLLASLLINRPLLVLLDEPFTHLDPLTRKGILSSLFTYIRNHGISVLWVTHDLTEALHFSDEIGVLNFGKLEQWGTPEEIVFQPRNLFVAEFAGYRNILPIVHEQGKWITPWGHWEHPNLNHWKEALMVIPPQSWSIDPEKKVVFRYVHSRVKDLWWEIEAESSGRHFFISLPQWEYEQIKHQLSFSLAPDFKNCFIISL